jgi:hypothetical protein
MSVYGSIMQGLTEAADYQQGKIHARKTKLTIKPVKHGKTVGTSRKGHPAACLFTNSP